ncbi:glycosyltransferase [Halothiobacillus sp. DCM-1]|uniref:glycosyltransferase n=1 Tax=Halothiobacillus sp. DCM-1 TaxID=3112558 RepID=UPI00324CA9B5
MNQPTRPRALFAVSSLGLGHATRSLVVMRHFLSQGYQLTVISTGNALAFLRMELADASVVFEDWPDYPPLERGTGWRFYMYLAWDLFQTWRRISAENRRFAAIAAQFDVIFSDGRYGIFHSAVPSVILSHQIAFIPPKGLREVGWLSDWLNVSALKKFDAILIPDYPCPSLNLAGNLSHTPVLHGARHDYIGILSSYPPPPPETEQDIDFLFVISGYLQEHKGAFVRGLLEQARSMPGRKVFVLGDANANPADYAAYEMPDLTIYPLASGDLRQTLFNRARCVVSRAGYTTVMDLVEHDKPALLIPTPNQTEQEYLGFYLGGLGYFATRPQTQDWALPDAVQDIHRTARFQPPWRTAESLKRIDAVLAPLVFKNFFSIIVPAHNEAAELGRTLDALFAQHYPAGRWEVIVVENGSTDGTLAIAQSYLERAELPCAYRVIQSERGVSNAKNAGLAAVDPQSQWVVFCDADTRLLPGALLHFNTWLNRQGEGQAVGTTAVRPFPDRRWRARAWFALYDGLHRFTRSSYAIQIARTPIARGVGFHPELNFAEDLTFIRECLRYGRFFFVPTEFVQTSTRRFEANGYLRQSLKWLVEALMPMRYKRHRGYDVIR